MLWIIGAFLVAFVLFFLWHSGCFSNVEVSIVEKPRFLGSPLTVYYRHVVGSYANAYLSLKEALSILPKGSTAFGIYYDDPSKVKSHLLQSAVGVVVAKDGNELVDASLQEQLSRHGLEKMVIPAVSRAVVATLPTFSCIAAALPVFSPVAKLYGAVKTFVTEHRLETSLAVEVYEGDSLTVHFPLDHVDEFVVPEKVSVQELEARLARRKFDSDEESSESEASGDEDPEEEEGEKGAEGDAHVE